MAGSFRQEQMLRVWHTLAPEAALDGAMLRGTQLGFFKFLTASGNAAGGRRRSSAASGAVGRFVFSHLRILDNVLELLLRDDARQLHEACARTLEGVVDTLQLAMHSEQAGMHQEAAQLWVSKHVLPIVSKCTAQRITRLASEARAVYVSKAPCLPSSVSSSPGTAVLRTRARAAGRSCEPR